MQARFIEIYQVFAKKKKNKVEYFSNRSFSAVTECERVTGDHGLGGKGGVKGLLEIDTRTVVGS